MRSATAAAVLTGTAAAFTGTLPPLSVTVLDRS